MHKIKNIFFLFIVTVIFSFGNSSAQTTSDYFLLPGSSVTLPVGQTIPIKVCWIDANDMNLHLGEDSYHWYDKVDWYINGNPWPHGDGKEGSLSLENFVEGKFTAPNEVPPVNPVNISVKFKSNDSTRQETVLFCNVNIIKPKNRWFVTITANETKKDSRTSSSVEEKTASEASGTITMLIKVPPSDQEGNVNIDTGNEDEIISSSVAGNYGYNYSEISKDILGNVNEKILRNYTGTAEKDRAGILFLWSPKEHQAGMSSGIIFDADCRDRFWKMNNDYKLVLKGDWKHQEKSYSSILIGNHKDIIKKIKDGFTIDHTEAKDTTYSTVLGEKIIQHANLTYHVTIKYLGGKSN